MNFRRYYEMHVLPPTNATSVPDEHLTAPGVVGTQYGNDSRNLLISGEEDRPTLLVGATSMTPN